MSGICTLADIETIERVSLSARELPPTTYAALQRGAAVNPGKPALVFFLQGTAYQKAVSLTYHELVARVHQVANMLHDLGIGPHDVVSMILPNTPEAWFTILGGEAAGIVNPINPMLQAEVMADIMNAAGTKVLVTLAPFPQTDIWEKVSTILHRVPTLQAVLRVDLANYLGGVPKLAVKLMRMRGKQPSVSQPVYDFAKKVAAYPSVELMSRRAIQPDDIAAYFHTGGTTGIPKLACHTHFNEVVNAWSAAQGIEISPETVMFCGLPLFHVNGVIVTGMIPFIHGATAVLGTPSGYRGEGVLPNFWKIVEHYHINFFSGVPTVYSTLLNVPVATGDISSLQYALCGAAPMPVEVFQAFETRTNVRILEGYGLTEGTCVSSVNPGAGERRIGSIGFRLPYQEMKIVELDAAGNYVRDCAVDEIGMVIIRGPNVFVGYKEEQDNKGIWVDTGDERGAWLNTGDLGRQDADGYFWLTGRKKELIIRGGHNIDPRLIEDPLQTHAAVAMAAAVGRPDARLGEVPVAYVMPLAGKSVDAEELLAYAQAHIGERAAVPKLIKVVPELPLTTVGKIFKPQLMWWEIEDVYQQLTREVAGVTAVTVTVGPDKLHGTTAQVQIAVAADADETAVLKAVRAALGQYTTHYTLEVSQA